MVSLFILGAALAAGDLPDAAAPFRVSPTGIDRHSSVHHDVDIAGDHWSRGATYKSRAADSGFSFVPFLGSDAPRNYPVTFRLARVSRDGESLPLTERASVRRTDDRIVLDRGSVEVRYDLEPESVEQSFALDLPGGAGDLVLRLDVDTDLTVSADGGGFRFENERGGMTYGAAVAFDAEGRETEVAASWTGDGIELRVPAAFLDHATGPLIVDPLFTAFTVHSSSDDLFFPDTAYDAQAGRYCVVFEERFSVVDHDVFSIFVNGVNGAATGGQYIELGAATWLRPRIAFRDHTREFLVVAEARTAPGSNRFDVVARRRTAAGALGAPYVLKAATASYHCRRPDVGGQNTSDLTPLFCVVYNRFTATTVQLWAIPIGTNGQPFGPEIAIVTNPAVDAGPPSISDSTGVPSGAQEFCLAWPAYRVGTEESAVQTLRIPIDLSGVFIPIDVVPYTDGAEYSDVCVSSLSDVRHRLSGQQQYLIAFDGAGSVETDALVSICHGAAAGAPVSLTRSEHGEVTVQQRNLRVATTPDDFIVGYTEQGTLLTTVIQPIDGDVAITERRLSNAGPNAVGNMLCAASHLSGGGHARSAAFFWTNLSGSDYEIHGAFAEADPALTAAGSQYCYGTENGTGDRGFIRLTGTRNPFEVHELRAEALPRFSFGYFLSSTTDDFVPNAGGNPGTLCLGGSIGRFGVFNSGTDGAGTYALDPQAIPQPNGVSSAFAGHRWAFQCWHRDSVGGVATSNFTNAVSIVFR